MRPTKLWTCPDDRAARTQAPCCQQSSCGSVRRERGGDRCTQQRFKVEGEELTTASPLPSGMTGVAVGGSDLNWERNPWAGLEYDVKDLNLKLELFIP